MNERLLITGAQGFIGRNLAAHWLGSSPRALVLGVGRSPRRDDVFPHHVHSAGQARPAPVPIVLRRALASDRYGYERVDVLDVRALAQRIADFRPDAIVHLAGALRDEPLDRLLAVNIGGTVALLDAVAASGHRPARIVLGSSAAIYGPTPAAALPIGEDAPPNPVDLYGVSRLAAEQAARVAAARHGLGVIFARIFNPVGAGQDERHVTSRLAMQATAGPAPEVEVGALQPTRDFVDVRDVARALALLATAGERGLACNVASGVETAVSAILDEVLRVAGVADRARILRRPDTSRVARQVADIARLRALGFAPAFTVADAIAEVVRWYAEEVAAAAPEAVAPEIGPAVEVEVRDVHPYTVVVAPGLAREIPARLRALRPDARVAVLTDARVLALHGGAIVEGIRGAGLRCDTVVLPEGEAGKQADTWHAAIERLHALGIDRRALLVNLGGGAIIDLGGFVAATYLRGLDYVNVPTTLLAQHDAAIGGKVAINAPWAKNFIGAFHHPRAVLADPALLATLDARHVAAGVAEAVKVALCGEPRLFALVEEQADAIRRRDPAVLTELVRRAAQKKAALLAPDPRELDLRRPLNLGHCLAHPIEAELGYEGVLHGEAVAFGIVVATEIAHARGILDHAATRRIRALLATFALPPPLPRDRLHAACDRLADIRLVRGRALLFVLPVALDRVAILDDVDETEVRAAIDAVVGVNRPARAVTGGD